MTCLGSSKRTQKPSKTKYPLGKHTNNLMPYKIILRYGIGTRKQRGHAEQLLPWARKNIVHTTTFSAQFVALRRCSLWGVGFIDSLISRWPLKTRPRAITGKLSYLAAGWSTVLLLPKLHFIFFVCRCLSCSPLFPVYQVLFFTCLHCCSLHITWY